MEKIITHKEAFEDNRIVFSGLLVFCLLVVGESVGKENIDLSMQICLFLCAVSIPLLATSIALTKLETGFKVTTRPEYFNWLVRIAVGSSLAAITSTFFHFSKEIGLIFIVSIIASFTVAYFFIGELQKNNEDEINDAD